MIERLRYWLLPPVFPDEEQTRVSRILYVVLLTLLAASVIVGMTSLATNNYIVRNGLALGCLLVLGSIVLARNGRLQLASSFSLVTILGIQIYLLYRGQGIHDIAIIIYPINIILASMLLQSRGFTIFIGLSISSVLVVVWGDSNGLTNTLLGDYTSWVDFVMVTVLILVTAVAVRLLTSDLTQSLRHARQQEQKLAEANQQLAAQTQNLQVSEARWRALAANIPDTILNIQPDGTIEFTNLTDATATNTLIGKNLAEFVRPEDKSRLRTAIAQAVTSQQPAQYESQARLLRSDYRWFDTRVGPLVQNGAVQSLTLIATDITERKVTEALLRESERRYRTLFESSPISLWEADFSAVGTYLQAVAAQKPTTMTWDTFLQQKPLIAYRCARKAAVVNVNQRTVDLFVAADKEAIYTHLPHIFSVEGSNLFQQAILILLAGQRSFSGEAQLKTLTGQPVHVIFYLTVVPGYEASWEKVFVSLLDITERHAADAERETLIDELELKNAELERFTYTVSHDLKSPLITIQGFLGFLQQDVANQNWDQLQTDVDHIRQATEKMQGLLNDLLELSRIGRLTNPPEAVPFSDLVHEAMKLVAGQITQQQVEINTQTGLPAVYGDKPRLVEVLQNLLDNAIKYMGDQPNPIIRVGWQANDETAVFFVRDNGKGIAPRYHEKIFGLFERLDQSIIGTGIGLALVKRIIEVHNGRIWVESDGTGRGSTFYFTLPLAEVSS